MLRLVGGPWNNRIIADLGMPQISMVIYSDKSGSGVPREGCKLGNAIYEPNEERTHAFFLKNDWLGVMK